MFASFIEQSQETLAEMRANNAQVNAQVLTISHRVEEMQRQADKTASEPKRSAKISTSEWRSFPTAWAR